MPTPTSAPPAPVVVIRDARLADRDRIVEFNVRLADETEHLALDRAVLARGVEAALADPSRLRYWIAECDGAVVGQSAITREWSDWRAGWLWWFQSVYVAPEARGRGVFRGLHAAIYEAARAAGDVVGLRLYVEAENTRAQQTYRALGLEPGGYHVYEELWIEQVRTRPG